jgi:hypothetical protein
MSRVSSTCCFLVFAHWDAWRDTSDIGCHQDGYAPGQAISAFARFVLNGQLVHPEADPRDAVLKTNYWVHVRALEID